MTASLLSHSPRTQSSTSEESISGHFIRNCLEEGSIKTSYITTQEQLADLLTKSLGRIKFHELREKISMTRIAT